VTPLRRLTGFNRLARFRRLVGLFAFFYATLHFATYIGLDRFFDFRDIGDDILKRPTSPSASPPSSRWSPWR
jgi:methionine sulfoxide reductase heme-binding subunit